MNKSMSGTQMSSNRFSEGSLLCSELWHRSVWQVGISASTKYESTASNYDLKYILVFPCRGSLEFPWRLSLE
jgi:hypothetical protein